MEDLNIQEGEIDGDIFPLISGSISQNEIIIRGNSIMCDVIGAYDSLIDWIKLYIETKPKSIKLDFYMEYYNTMTQHVFKKIISSLADYNNLHISDINVRWFSLPENIDMIEDGELFQQDFPDIFHVIIKK